MPTQATRTHDWNDIFSSSLDATEGMLFDNIFKDNAFLQKLLAADQVETEDGGRQITKTLEYADGGGYQNISGYQPIDLSPNEIMTTAVDDWKEAVVHVSISRKEERQNSGRHGMINLVTARLKNASKSFREGIAKDIMAPSGTNQAAGTNCCNPLVQLVPIIRSSSPENTTLHNINPSTATWWKPSTNGRVKSGSSNNTTAWTAQDYKDEIRHTVLSISADSGELPNLALGTQAAYEKYVGSLDIQVRYTNANASTNDIMRDAMVEGMPFVWDRRMIGTTANATDTVNFDASPAEEVIYFLNMNYLYMIFDSESKFKNLGFREPTNQLARSAIVVCMFQLMTTNRRSHGALYGIDVSAI